MKENSPSEPQAARRLQRWKIVRGEHRNVPIYIWRRQRGVRSVLSPTDRRRLFGTASRRKILVLAQLLADAPPISTVKKGRTPSLRLVPKPFSKLQKKQL